LVLKFVFEIQQLSSKATPENLVKLRSFVMISFDDGTINNRYILKDYRYIEYW